MDRGEVEQIVDGKLAACRDSVAQELHQLNESLRSAFPRDEDGLADFSGHREHHEQLIATAKAEAEFWRELRKEIIRKGVIGLLIVCVGLMVVGLKVKLGIGGP